MKRRSTKQHMVLRLGIFQQKIVKAKKGGGSFERHKKHKKGTMDES